MSVIMVRMRYTLLLGWGVVIYAIMFLLWTLLVTYGIVNGIVPHTLGFIVLVGVTAIAARSLHLSHWAEILPYSFTWALMMVAIDALLNVPVNGWAMFADWSLWVGYGLVVVVPLLAPKLTRLSR